MTSAPNVVMLLARTSLFAAMDESDRAAVADQMREVKFEPGRLIFARSDLGQSIYLLIEGRVRLSVLTPDGKELMLRHAGPGDVFGEIAALDGGPRTADATAVTRVRAMVLTHTSLFALIERRPGMVRSALRFVCQRLRETSDQVESIALYRLEARLARYLLSLVRGLASECEITEVQLPMSQGDLALMLGATRQSVNAALGALVDTGAIERSGNRIVCRLGKLAGIAAGEIS